MAHDDELLEYLSPFKHDWHYKTERVIHGIDYGQDSSPGERLFRQGHFKSEGVRVIAALEDCRDVDRGHARP